MEGVVSHRVSGHVRCGDALRSLVYAGLAGQKLRKHFRNLGEPHALVVVSLVLYHGASPWNAPVSVEDLVPGLTEYVLVRPEAVDPQCARLEDIPALVLGLLVPGQTAGELGRRLDALARALGPGIDPQLRKRIALQLRPVLASVYDHSLLKETSPMATLLEIFTEAHIAERAQFRNEGRLEGQARTIMHQAAQRFGPETARRLSRLLAGVTDMDCMDRVAEVVIDCGDDDEFLARVGALLQTSPARAGTHPSKE